MDSEREVLSEAGMGDVIKEMAMPRMARSARHGISHENRRPNQPMRSNVEAPPKISFDLAGVVTLDQRFATGATIFSQGDTAETLIYIQKGRVKLSVTSKTRKEAIEIMAKRIEGKPEDLEKNLKGTHLLDPVGNQIAMRKRNTLDSIYGSLQNGDQFYLDRKVYASSVDTAKMVDPTLVKEALGK